MTMYQCHKKVNAAKIVEISFFKQDQTYGIRTEDEEMFLVPAVWMAKNPDTKVGGYLVEYEDAYISYSSAGPFEAGYTEVK